jgi:hypothetical protein
MLSKNNRPNNKQGYTRFSFFSFHSGKKFIPKDNEKEGKVKT